MFILIGMWGGPNRHYASMKFLIFTHVGSVLMLLGFILLFLISGTFDLTLLTSTSIAFPLQLLIMMLTFVGFAVKLPMVPLHTWLPDAHVEAPAPISVLLAGVLLKMGGYGFIRISLTVFPAISALLAPIIVWLAILTIFYGAFVALVQRDLKRMIALTSINHMGLVLLGAFLGNLVSLSGAVFQMFNHACAVGLLFLLSGVIEKRAGTRDIDQLAGMGTTMPWASGLFIAGSFAAMGLPFLANFVSEFMVFAGVITIYPLLAFVVLSPGIVSGYFIWTIDRTILSDPLPGARMQRARGIEVVAVALLMVPIILLGLFPGLMVDRIVPACIEILSLGGP
jgi:NADH-quinone oxidoreductase subunit M